MSASDSTTHASAPSAAVLVIGDEILSGRTKDKNIGFIAETLTEVGIDLLEVRIVADVEAAIVEAVQALSDRYEFVFTTGGIGPTHDDITADAIARAFGLPIDIDQRAVDLLEPFWEARGIQPNEARLRMARIPEGAALIPNAVSAAPGFVVRNVFVMAGVPAIMQAMFDGLKGRLAGGAPVRQVSVPAFIAEGTIAKGLSELQARFLDIDIGSYPFFRTGRFGTSLVLRGTDEAKLALAAEELRALIRSLGAEPLDSEPA